VSVQFHFWGSRQKVNNFVLPICSDSWWSISIPSSHNWNRWLQTTVAKTQILWLISKFTTRWD